MSFLWIIRALNLLIILPRKSPVDLRYVYNLYLVTVILAYFSSKYTAATSESTHEHLASAIRFDRRIAAISLFMDASANALIAVSPTSSQALFVFLTSLNALTSGGHPALQSLGAVSLRAMGKGDEMGLVFGALGVANAVSHIIAVRPHHLDLGCLAHLRTFVCSQPGTYAAIYGATVAAFPKAMFVVSAALLYITVSLLARIRPNIHVPTTELESTITVAASEEVEDAGEEGSHVHVRNRSRSREPSNDALREEAVMLLSIPED